MRFVGLDLGARKVCFCEVRGGEVVDRTSAPSVEKLVGRLGPNTGKATVVIEAGRQAWHVHDKLVSWGHEVIVADTTRVRQIGIGHHGQKFDRIDAEGLAKACERGGVPASHVLSPHRRELRNQLSIRNSVVSGRASIIHQIKALARGESIKLPRCSPNTMAKALAEAPLPANFRMAIEPLCKCLETFTEQLRVCDAKLDQLCEQEPVVQLLATMPGVGRIVSAMFVSVIDEAGRFKNGHQVSSYLGLVPRENTTGGKQRLGHITKAGNTRARSLLVQAAWSFIRTAPKNDPMHIWAEAIAERRDPKIAAVAVARKMAGVLHAMWRDGTVYDGAQLAKDSAAGLKARAKADTQRAQAMSQAARKLSKSSTSDAAKGAAR